MQANCLLPTVQLPRYTTIKAQRSKLVYNFIQLHPLLLLKHRVRELSTYVRTRLDTEKFIHVKAHLISQNAICVNASHQL